MTAHPYVALIHFHGMGSQRRFEELSRLTDSLDRHLTSLGRRIGKIDVALEPPRSKLAREVGYLSIRRGNHFQQELRFYESYWASITAGGASARGVLWWLLRNAAAPVFALLTQWRHRARLRRSALLRLWAELAITHPQLLRPLQLVLQSYDEFEGWEARRNFPAGRYRHFRKFLAREHPSNAKLLVELADWWHADYLLSEWRNLAVLTSIVVLLLFAAGLTLLGLSWTVDQLPHRWTAWVTPADMLSMAAAAIATLGVGGFLRNYLGDVQFWSTYEETSEKHAKRREILDHAVELVAHVADDPLCERIVIVSHSLGTSIAYDTLLELARRNRVIGATPRPLEKISHLVTCGSPIDKVHYFFESYVGKHHRYNRVVEKLRGDIGTVPFSANGWPLIHWVNFWDRADVISAALYSPGSRKHPHVSVDNCEISSGFFPDPARAHTLYLDHPTVVATIREILEGRHAYPALGGTPEPPFPHLGPGGGRGSTRPFQYLALSIPWLVLAHAVLRYTGFLATAKAIQWFGLGIFAVLLGGWLVGLSDRLRVQNRPPLRKKNVDTDKDPDSRPPPTVA
jgi:hypothetical protein